MLNTVSENKDQPCPQSEEGHVGTLLELEFLKSLWELGTEEE
jgi:hypothetical protein